MMTIESRFKKVEKRLKRIEAKLDLDDDCPTDGCRCRVGRDGNCISCKLCSFFVGNPFQRKRWLAAGNN